MIPKLWSEDVAGCVKWIKEFLAQQALGGTTETTEDGAPVTSESVGMARVWLGPDVPSGWLALDGSYVFISEAEALYQLLGNAGGAPPAGMFKLPDAPSALASGQWIIKR
jgi:hypothetical protein